MYLRALGAPALLDAEGRVVVGLRRKDLALLVYLLVEHPGVHTRGTLAALLWGDDPEERARHSLTQSLRRVQQATGVLEVGRDRVRLTGTLPSDLGSHAREGEAPGDRDEVAFLEGFDPGAGAQDFSAWADRVRAAIRARTAQQLAAAGSAAEAEGNWQAARLLGERLIRIDPLSEEGHRRITRALRAQGEQNQALRHFSAFSVWLEREIGATPAGETVSLAREMERYDASAAEVRKYPPEQLAPFVSDALAGPSPVPIAPAPANPIRGARQPRRIDMAAALLLVIVAALAVRVRTAAHAGTEPLPMDGESIRLGASGPAYLVYGGTLFQYPDARTERVCSTVPAQRRVRRLPRLPVRMLLSVREYRWLGDTLPVVTDHPSAPTAFVATGCVMVGIADPATFVRIFTDSGWRRMIPIRDSLFLHLPRAPIAQGHPVRAKGTLVRSPTGETRVVAFHGGAFALRLPHMRLCQSALEVSGAELASYRVLDTLSEPPLGCKREASVREE